MVSFIPEEIIIDILKRLPVWMMNYGVHGSWTKMFTMGETSGNGAFGNMYPKQSFKNGVILVHVGCSKSYLYDPKHKEFTKLVINGCAVISTWDFMGSLVSPNNLPNSRGHRLTISRRSLVSVVARPLP
ncbi:hypothetical protein C5167_022144 [Papaver somniferum]|uniref:F-box associated domain-containing protein n=1 Tax=Papaver somniferum TaxID=3469 RepID=A0A4Y7JL45_PAPSO|nr:hypothetical protein C5167_022144 [Papaver somniferum]